MKYLNSFNERLKSSTYFNASNKLRELGHDRRSGVLRDWANKVEKKEYYDVLKKYQDEYSKYGSYRMSISKSINNTDEKILEGNFYIKLSLDSDWTWDSLVDIKANGFKKPYFIFDMEFIPADDETVKLIDDFYTSEEDNNGWVYDYSHGYIMYFSRLFISGSLEYKSSRITNDSGLVTSIVNNPEIRFTNFSIDDKAEKWDQNARKTTFYGFRFTDRVQSVKFRNNIFKSLNDKDNWGINPLSAIGNWNVSFSDSLSRFINGFNNDVLSDLSIKFDYDILTKSIRSTSINQLYSK